jgi:hypothetical protein
MAATATTGGKEQSFSDSMTTTTSRPRRTVRQALAERDPAVLASMSRIAAGIRQDLERLAQLPEGHDELEGVPLREVLGALEACWRAPAAERAEQLAVPATAPRMDRPAHGGPGDLKPSGRRNPCPICGRTADGDCRTGDGLAICHHGSSHHPPEGLRPGEVIDGRDGQRWAFTGETADGRGSTFTLDKPREGGQQPRRPAPHRQAPTPGPAPAPIAGPVELARLPQPCKVPPAHLPDGQRITYSPTQWVEVVRRGSKKQHLPRHTGADGETVQLAGPDPWPLWREGDALEHGPGRWIAEAEGEKCAAWLRAAGLVAVSQPGHDHKASSIEARYRRLVEAGVAGVVYLGDNDKTGATKAQRCAAAAAAVGLPQLVVPAAEVWPGLPVGGSIDDAPGTAAERAAALRAAVPAALERHQQQGQAAARQAVPKPAAGDPFRVLGWCPDRSRVFYQHRQTGQIASIKPAAQAGPLLQLAPIGWWASLHPGGRSIDWAAACSEVIEAANRAGVFAVDRVRGRGLWMEGSRTVWHLGDRLEVEGREVALIEHRSAHHYPRLPALEIDANLPPLSDAEGQEILGAVAAMGWSSPLDPIHLLGWAVLANVGGALEKRPVLQLTSRFGSGKTYTRERVLEPLLAGLAISRSNSTEAGIRQLLRADALPVLIDESEGEDHSRREGHLRLARLSYDGSPTDRGTTHGQAISFAVRSAVALVGINATINNPAERSRTVLVGREQLPQAEWAAVDRRLAELLTPETGARLLRRAVNNLHSVRANVATFRRAVEAQLGGGAAARAGDTLGALLAGAYLLTSEALVDDGQAIDWLDLIGWSAAAALGESGGEGQDATAESRQCLAQLLGHEEPWRVDTGTGRLSVRELLELARSPSGADDAEQARKALGRRGIRATDCGLEVANTAEALAPIYSRTKWRDGGHRARLLDLPGAYAAGMVRFPVLGACRACKLPWELLT